MKKGWVYCAAAILTAAAVLSGCGQSSAPAETTIAETTAAGTAAAETAASAAETEAEAAASAAAAAVETTASAAETASETAASETTAAGSAETNISGPAMIRIRVSETREYVFSQEYEEKRAMVQSAEVQLPRDGAKEWPHLAEMLQKINREELQVPDKNREVLILNGDELRKNTGEEVRLLSEELHVVPGRSDEEAVSLLKVRYSDMGGSHNYWEYRGWTIDPKSGKLLKLPDVVSDPEALPGLIVEAMREEDSGDLSAASGGDPEKAIAEVLKQSEEAGVDYWYLTSQGLEFIFGPYVLDLGFSEQRAVIPYQDHPELFRVSVPEYPAVYQRDVTMPEEIVSENGTCQAVISMIEADRKKHPELFENLQRRNEKVEKRAEDYLEECRKDGETAADSFFSEVLYITADILRLDNETLTFSETTSLSGVSQKAADEAKQVREYSYDIKTGNTLE